MQTKTYRPASDTLLAFHKSDAQFRALVGAVGSGKTTAALMEVCMLLPRHIAQTYGITHTRWAVVRKTLDRLMDTDWFEIDSWFPANVWHAQRKVMELHHPGTKDCPALFVELYFRSNDQPDSMDKFRSLNLTGFWIDESHEVHESAKQMLATRIGRFPKGCPVRYGIETSNPMPIDHIMYRKFKWVGSRIDPATGELEMKRPPGPIPPTPPVQGYIGWWQPPGENVENLRPGYYEDLARDFPESPEMLQVLIGGKPGYKPEGKGVYRNFDMGAHMAEMPLTWMQVLDQRTGQLVGCPLYAGWDNSGNAPACVVGQRVGPFALQVLREFYDDRMGIIDFTKWVVQELEAGYPGHVCTSYCDPAGFAQYSSREGGLTSNAQMQSELCGIKLLPSSQALDLRINTVDQMLARRNGILIDPGCTRLINGFQGGYVYEEHVRMGINEFKPDPKKNKFSHVHDALQYLVVPVFYPSLKAEVRETMESRMILRSPWDDARDVAPGAVRAYRGGETADVAYDSRFAR